MQEEIQALGRRAAFAAAALAAAGFAAPAHASFLSGDALDAFANVLAWVILFLVPVAAVGIFWYVHILPEVIAEKRHHPQKDSIKVLCILSLFFGGLLWPFAWLWAYTRPVVYKAAYGSDRHEDYYLELGEKARAGELVQDDMRHLEEQLDAMATKGPLSPPLQRLRDDLAAIASANPAGRPVPVVSAPAPEKQEV